MSNHDDPPLHGWFPEAHYDPIQTGIPIERIEGIELGVRTAEIKLNVMKDDMVDALQLALSNFGSNVPMLITPMTCCDRCEVMDALAEPIKRKIDLLVQLGSNTRRK